MGTARITQLTSALCVGLVVVGCGGTKHAATSGSAQTVGSASTAPQAVTPAKQAVTPLASSSPLFPRVLHNGELAGMNPSPPPTVVTRAATWASAGSTLSAQQQQTEAVRLSRLGFKAGIGENLVTPGDTNRYGLSLLEQFSSQQSALGEVAHAASPSGQAGAFTIFKVPQIPRAVGFEQAGPPGTGGGRNIAFADSGFYYLVGAGWNPGESNPVSRAQLKAAAIKLYQRVRGRTG